MSPVTPASVQKLQTALHAKAKESPNFRFYGCISSEFRFTTRCELSRPRIGTKAGGMHKYPRLLHGFLYSTRSIIQYILRVVSDNRIEALIKQLLRAEHPEVLDEVAAQIHIAVDEYVRAKTSDIGALPSPFPEPA
jgi:hypothetical protein